jgi:scyllo-inosamine-4-phosphate amidinotransferase 1
MINSSNEWGKLKKVILGSSENMNWPSTDHEFNKTKIASGVIPEYIIYETEIALDFFSSELEKLGVDVLRPKKLDYKALDGFGCYCPRDTVLILGDTPILTPTVWKQRRVEWESMIEYLPNAVTVDDPKAIFDAANVIRCNDDLLYLVSYSGNEAGADWIERNFPQYRVHRLRNVYANMHLDTTIVPLREGLVMLNAERLRDEQLPDFMKSWDKIWIHPEDIVADKKSTKATSNWIGMNLLSYDENTVFCDPSQKNIINRLRDNSIKHISVPIPHGQYLMGGHHCVTLDILRSL